jgi:hypothetical protein
LFPGWFRPPQAQGSIPDMGIGTSLFLIAVGAILNWAVTATVAGININTVGIILMVVGVLGLVISMLYASIWSDRRAGTAPDRPAVRERDVY